MTDLNKLKALCEAATEGPWEVSAYEGGWDCVRDSCNQIIAKLGLNIPANADFIATARTALPDLISEVEDLRKALEQIAELTSKTSVCRVASIALAKHGESK